MHQVVKDAARDTRATEVRQQTQIRNQKQAGEQYPMVRKQKVVCATRGNEEAESFGVQEKNRTEDYRLLHHDLQCKSSESGCQDLQ